MLISTYKSTRRYNLGTQKTNIDIFTSVRPSDFTLYSIAIHTYVKYVRLSKNSHFLMEIKDIFSYTYVPEIGS
jgi:hypothetical protein